MVVKLRTGVAGEDAAFQALSRHPGIAWPTLAVFFLALGILAGSAVAYLSGVLPLAAAVGLNTVAVYLMFTPTHEASHRALARHESLNVLFGRLSLFFWVPVGTFPIYRWLHMQHHRFTNEKGDPDLFAGAGRIWTLPLRWLVIDVYQIIFYLRYSGRVRKDLPGFLAMWCLTLSIIFIAHHFGYLYELVMLWLVPMRISLFVLTIMLDFLQHFPHRVPQSREPYRATAIRQGSEWLMTPLFLYHNYHLAHHLYPTLPFYRLIALWRAREAFHLAQNPRIVSAFSMHAAPEGKRAA